MSNSEVSQILKCQKQTQILHSVQDDSALESGTCGGLGLLVVGGRFGNYLVVTPIQAGIGAKARACTGCCGKMPDFLDQIPNSGPSGAKAH